LELPQRDIGSTAHKMDANESPVCLLRRRVEPKQAIRQTLGCVQRFAICGIGHAQMLGKPLRLIAEALPVRREELLDILWSLHASQQLALVGMRCRDPTVAVVLVYPLVERVDV